MILTDDQIKTIENQIMESECVKEMVNSTGWKVFSAYVTKYYEQKILDTFRRIPGSSQYDVSFRILQGEYQMLQQILRSPYEILEIGEQAKRKLESADDTQR